MSNDKKVLVEVPLGIGAVVSNYGTYKGLPAVFLEPVNGERGIAGNVLEEGREPQIKADAIADGVILILHDTSGVRVVVEDIESALNIASTSDESDGKPPTAEDMAMIIKQLVRTVKKLEPENKFASKAIDYLVRKQLMGSILR